MSKNLKLFVLSLVVIFSGFIISMVGSEDDSDSNTLDVNTVEEINPQPFEVTYHSDQSTQKVNHKLDSLFKRIHKRHDFHGSVLVAQHGKVIFTNEYGYANFRNKTAIDSTSAFQLASVSKQFTAGAIMILKERNLLKLTDTVTNIFPEFPYKEVTINHLLNHTAGLPNYFWIAEHKWKQEKAPSNQEMMDLMNKTNINRFFRPGRKFDYSNTAYFVLASIIEKVSKQSYADFLKENIFEPLQMHDSYAYSFEHDSIKPNQVDGYRIYRGWRHAIIKGTVNDGVIGDKNVYSTSKDLYKWILGLNSGMILSKESVELMYTNGKTRYGRNVPYGYGFRLSKKNNEKIIFHYGRWNGFSTAVTQFTNSDIVVIALDHSSFRSMSYLNKSVKKIVLDNFEPEPSEILFVNSEIDANQAY